jgi:hypothetical protein
MGSSFLANKRILLIIIISGKKAACDSSWYQSTFSDKYFPQEVINFACFKTEFDPGPNAQIFNVSKLVNEIS